MFFFFTSPPFQHTSNTYQSEDDCMEAIDKLKQSGSFNIYEILINFTHSKPQVIKVGTYNKD